MRARTILLAMLLATLAGRASGEEAAEGLARARAHFDAGRALYSLGNYRDALREFTAGYQLAPRPSFLINLGHTYRKLDELDKAAEVFRRFLAVTPADDPLRPQVVDLLAAIDQQLATRAARPTPLASPGEGPTTTVRAAPAAALATPTPLSASHRRLKRYWWLLPVGGAVAAGLAVGIYFAVRPTSLDCGSPGLLACVDVRMNRP
jgi:tetratricopeptide (TPR) repeat protein